MSELGLTADGTRLHLRCGNTLSGICLDAVNRISAVRTQVQPTEFFLHQLEMYERMNYDVDPAKYAEYRRFLMVCSSYPGFSLP